MMDPKCQFCLVASRAVAASIIFEDELSLAFLDHRPIFPGHVLLIPKEHVETLGDLDADRIGPLFANAQRLARAVEHGMEAEGTFVAINNRVSQSVPHLHVHIVPRKKKDGLRGFFWPRQKYKDENEMKDAQSAIQRALSGK